MLSAALKSKCQAPERWTAPEPIAALWTACNDRPTPANSDRYAPAEDMEYDPDEVMRFYSRRAVYI
jgi:hypothetical protein